MWDEGNESILSDFFSVNTDKNAGETVEHTTNHLTWENAIWSRIQTPIQRYDMEGNPMTTEGNMGCGRYIWNSRNVSVEIKSKNDAQGNEVYVATVSNDNNPLLSTLARLASEQGWDVKELPEWDTLTLDKILTVWGVPVVTGGFDLVERAMAGVVDEIRYIRESDVEINNNLSDNDDVMELGSFNIDFEY